jgi:trimethylamine--corrinoid protein Co-methyltransferase
LVDKVVTEAIQVYCGAGQGIIVAPFVLGGYQVLVRGMNLDDNALARDAYREVEPGGHFLGCAHTMSNYQSAHYDAPMSDSESFEQWTEKGSKDATSRAYERWNSILDEYRPPAIDEGVDEALREYVTRKKAAVVDGWY